MRECLTPHRKRNEAKRQHEKTGKNLERNHFWERFAYVSAVAVSHPEVLQREPETKKTCHYIQHSSPLLGLKTVDVGGDKQDSIDKIVHGMEPQQLLKRNRATHLNVEEAKRCVGYVLCVLVDVMGFQFLLATEPDWKV